MHLSLYSIVPNTIRHSKVKQSKANTSKKKQIEARFAAIAFSNLRNNNHQRRHFGLFNLDTLVLVRGCSFTYNSSVNLLFIYLICVCIFLKRIVSISTSLSIIGFDKLVIFELLTHSVDFIIIKWNRFTRFKCTVEHTSTHAPFEYIK